MTLVRNKVFTICSQILKTQNPKITEERLTLTVESTEYGLSLIDL